MARILIVGCGCRGRALASSLMADGHAVRGTTRHFEAAPALADCGIEPWVGDPLRLSTLTRALDAVTIVCWLLASARGPSAELEALHGRRLRAYLRETVDTTVRGFVYETRGSVDRGLLADGREIVDEMSRTWKLPAAVLEPEPGQRDAWVREALDAVNGLLAPRPVK